MTTQASRIPVPCRYFHTAKGCPYGKWCKYDHYSNNPSYFNYIKQKLHQISKPQKPNHKNNQNMIHIIIESMQKCITDIINKEFHGLYQEMTALKSTIDRQNKLIQNHNKHLSESVFTKQMNKITKLLKQNIKDHKANNKPNKVSNKTKKDDDEWNNIFSKLGVQLEQLQNDKQQFETQITSISSTKDESTITKIPPPRNHKKHLKQSQTASPFDNISQYENLFDVEITPHPVTMDQISALPIPPKTKPNPIKKNMKQTNVIAITSKRVKQKKGVLVKGKNKKVKRNHSKHRVRKKQCRSKQKQKHNNNGNVIDSTIELAALNYMNDTDWYQIVRSDSSDDDESNMTTEDVKKLDMLDSI